MVLTYVYFNSSEIKERAVIGLNEVIVSKVQVGRVSLSMFKRFPKTTLILEHVTINDPVQQERYLCKDATLFLDFNSLDLLFGNYNLDRVGLRANFVRLVKHPDQWNYILWKQDSTHNSNVNINLKSFDWDIDSLYLKVDGWYAESKTEGKLQIEYGRVSANTELGFARIFHKKQKYTIPKSQVSIAGFNSGSQSFASATLTNELIKITANKKDSLNYAVTGQCFNLKQLGNDLNLNKTPPLLGEITFRFDADRQELSKPKNLRFQLNNVEWNEHRLKNINGAISLPDINAVDAAQFDLSGLYNGFRASLKNTGRSSENGNQILQLSSNNITLPLESDQISLSAQSAEILLSLPKLSSLNANFTIESLNFISGTVTGLQYRMMVQNQSIDVLGNAVVDHNKLTFISSNGTVNKQAISISATLPNLKPLLAKTPQLYLQVDAETDLLFLNLISELETKSTSDSTNQTTHTALDFNIELVVDAKQVRYDKIAAKDAFARLVIRPNQIEINSIVAKAFEGELYANGDYNLTDDNLSLSGFATAISSENVLKTFNNFNQEFVSYTNCKGSVDLNFDLKSVAFWKGIWGYSKFNVHMYNAELKNLPFLDDIKVAVKQNVFAKLILNEDELFEKLSFINLQEAKASVSLEDKTVKLSSAIFRSPEINLNSSGQYFAASDSIDFQLQFFIKDFFARGAKDDSYYVPERKGSTIKFYLKGEVNNPDIGIIKKGKKGNRSTFQSSKDFDNTPKGGTIFVVEEENKAPKTNTETEGKEKGKKKSGWFKKMLEKGESLEDTSKVEFGIE